MTENKPESDKVTGLGRVRSATKIPTDYGDFTLAELNEMLRPQFEIAKSGVHPDAIAKDPDAMEFMRQSGSRNPIYGGPIAAPDEGGPIDVFRRDHVDLMCNDPRLGGPMANPDQTGRRELYHMTHAERMAIEHDPERDDCVCFECRTGMARE